jgi:acyl transferase domain-containing protein
MECSNHNLPLGVDCAGRERIGHDQPSPFDPIAIVGFSVKFPQDATSEEAFWDLLSQRRSTMTQVPQDRWNGDAFYKPDGNKTGTVCKS